MNETRTAVTVTIAGAIVALSLVGWGTTGTLNAQNEHTKRMEQCVAAGGDYSIEPVGIKYECAGVSE